MLFLREFLLICGLGLAATGLTAYIMSWMLNAVHLRDHHPAARAEIGNFLFAPHAFGWYLRARYRALDDAGLNALGLLASIGAWAIVIGLVTCGVSQVIAWLAGVA